MESTTAKAVSAGLPAMYPQPSVEAEPVRYCLYARKSSEDDERQALSIESQLNEMQAIAKREGLSVTEIRRESHSAKASGKRPVFQSILADVRDGVFNGILTWAPDRLSRNAGDLGSLVDLMDQGLLHEIRTHGQRFRNSPNEKFLLMILCSQAKLENDNRGINVRRGQKTKAEMGIRPCMAPLGYLHQKGFGRLNKPIPDPDRAPIIKQAFELVAYKAWTGRRLMKWMNEEAGFRTRSGKPIILSILYRILGNEFYYGYYQYPKDSGNWIKGIHEPLITKEVFEKVRERLKVAPRAWGEKEFEYAGLMKCGACGGYISGEEKVKKNKSGKETKYIYYRCNNSRAGKCEEKYTREEIVSEQLNKLMDKMDLSQLGIRKQVEAELKRYQDFAVGVLGKDETKTKITDAEVRKYAKHLLQGKERDKFLEHLKGKLLLKGGELAIQNT